MTAYLKPCGFSINNVATEYRPHSAISISKNCYHIMRCRVNIDLFLYPIDIGFHASKSRGRSSFFKTMDEVNFSCSLR